MRKPAFLISLLFITLFLVTPVLAATPLPEPPNLGPSPAGPKQLEELIVRVINLIVPLAFIILTVILVWAGIKFMTSGGDPKSLSQSWSIITWAFLGVIFLVLAWLILLLVKAFTGVDVVNFSLCPEVVGSKEICYWQ